MPMKNPPHPGTGLADEFEELGLNTTKAAEALGVDRSTLHRVMKGDSAISADMALRLEKVIGSTADQWLRLQAAHDLARLRSDAAHPVHQLPRIAPDAPAAA